MSNSKSLISVIMPAYNAEVYITEAIESVLKQSWSNWELLIINDGSTDCTEEVIKPFLSDKRIQYFKQENKGVSAARNVGLKNMKGDYFCFLDADDVLPKKSLQSRIEVFTNNENVDFVDGRVLEKDKYLNKTLRDFKPQYRGNPFKEMINLKETCYLGLTWMVKRRFDIQYKMKEGQSHGEDFIFFLSLSRDGGFYDYTNEIILFYRRSESSAMSNLAGLDDGYISNYREISQWKEITSIKKLFFWIRTRKIMFLCYLFIDKSIKRAFLSLFKTF